MNNKLLFASCCYLLFWTVSSRSITHIKLEHRTKSNETANTVVNGGKSSVSASRGTVKPENKHINTKQPYTVILINKGVTDLNNEVESSEKVIDPSTHHGYVSTTPQLTPTRVKPEVIIGTSSGDNEDDEDNASGEKPTERITTAKTIATTQRLSTIKPTKPRHTTTNPEIIIETSSGDNEDDEDNASDEKPTERITTASTKTIATTQKLFTIKPTKPTLTSTNPEIIIETSSGDNEDDEDNASGEKPTERITTVKTKTIATTQRLSTIKHTKFRHTTTNPEIIIETSSGDNEDDEDDASGEKPTERMTTGKTKTIPTTQRLSTIKPTNTKLTSANSKSVATTKKTKTVAATQKLKTIASTEQIFTIPKQSTKTTQKPKTTKTENKNLKGNEKEKKVVVITINRMSRDQMSRNIDDNSSASMLKV